MKHVASATSTLFQLIYVFGLFVFLYSIIFALRTDGPFFAGDAKMAAGEISQALVTFGLRATIGLIGAALAWYILRPRRPAPPWFIRTSKILAVAWLVFVPIGTLVGFFMFRWCKPLKTEETGI